jgi:hypothetical protein
VFAAGLVGLILGTGLTTRARSLANDDAGVAVATAPAKPAPLTLRGVVREQGTGQPVAGARVNVRAVTDGAGRSGSSSSAVTDEACRYTIADLPKSREYAINMLPKPGEPYLITSRKVEATDDKGPVKADVE